MLLRICKKRWRRRNESESGLNIPPTAYFSEELSEEEIIFDRSTMGHKKINKEWQSSVNTKYINSASVPINLQTMSCVNRKHGH
ncbi:hypothetical protein OS493_034760 [Desmophyllum pertusum]|uniref:Uncharacterized protein n=1 Tax=Desmophyllum pertusum TaxID=174260 RepID=A0A9W9YXU0_9CNID|nr:hypothetical protein OS493_034760 [Desmophyllum pertusum]